MRPYMNLTDDELTAAIIDTYAARRKVAAGGDAVVIAGEGRRVEYTRPQAGLIDQDLRQMEYEARLRGLEIAGQGGAISVEFR
jgi:hypothetical protein